MIYYQSVDINHIYGSYGTKQKNEMYTFSFEIYLDDVSTKFDINVTHINYQKYSVNNFNLKKINENLYLLSFVFLRKLTFYSGYMAPKEPIVMYKYTDNTNVEALLEKEKQFNFIITNLNNNIQYEATIDLDI